MKNLLIMCLVVFFEFEDFCFAFFLQGGGTWANLVVISKWKNCLQTYFGDPGGTWLCVSAQKPVNLTRKEEPSRLLHIGTLFLEFKFV